MLSENDRGVPIAAGPMQLTCPPEGCWDTPRCSGRTVVSSRPSMQFAGHRPEVWWVLSGPWLREAGPSPTGSRTGRPRHVPRCSWLQRTYEVHVERKQFL